MNEIYGFAGKMLYVDLDSEKVSTKPLDMNLVKKFVGGMGITSWLTYSLTKRDTDPLSPSNVLAFGSGPLTGTIAPAASRTFVHSRSPVSGFIAQTNAGHSMGVMMKYAGYDNLVITGRAKKPVYLKISDEGAEIRDAGHLWGKDAWETTDLIQKDIGDYWVDCIGPSGENLVRYSIVLCSKRSSFNKTGIGAVMGSKNLKAIAARGTKGVKVADPKKLLQLTNAITKRLIADPELKADREFGGPYRSPSGFPAEEFVARVGKRPYACLSCPVGDKHLIELRDGKYSGLCYHISHLSAHGNRHSRPAGIENWDELAKCAEVENRLGIEVSEIASMIDYLVKCYENGVLTEKDIGFVPKKGGEALREFITVLVSREGIGALTGEGLMATVDKIKDSEKYSDHVKGEGRKHLLETGVGINIIGSLTNPRGGHGEMCHLPYGQGEVAGLGRGDLEKFCTDMGLSREATERVCAGPEGFNIGRVTKWGEDYTVIYMMLGICVRPFIMRAISLQELGELYEAVTGIETDAQQLLASGERVFNVLKAFNVRAGATKLDDMPSRGTTWPADKPIVAKNGKNYGSLDDILGQYYDERGWDPDTGVPTREKLTALGLESVAGDLRL